jgi:hypothetical protein
LESPGPLANVHAAFDVVGKCNECHVDNTPTLANAKCLDCHQHANLKDRIVAGKGFHASAQVRGRECWSCHRDHKGRTYDLRGWESIKGGSASFGHQ